MLHHVSGGKRGPVVLSPAEVKRHMHFIGKSGSGKSTAIATTLVQYIKQGIGIKLLSLDESTPNAQVGVIMYAPHFMRDQPEAARRFMIAYLRGGL